MHGFGFREINISIYTHRVGNRVQCTNRRQMRKPLSVRRRIVSSDETLADGKSNTPYGIPIYELIDRVSRKRDVNVAEVESNKTTTNDSKRRKKVKTESSLLCEKYRPQKFFDLLGNDDANRRVLRWLNYWRSCAYGLEPIRNEYTDSLGRPIQKVLILNGPPGCGKTTAAHVIAQQAGFDIIEINASDERGANVVKERIYSAITSHQVFSSRPISIIADEVEGASEHGFVRALTHLIKEDTKALANLSKDNGSSKKGSKRPLLLKRPIIAICNDVWSPSLHDLRQYSEIIHFQKQDPARLLKTLKQIAIDENLTLSTKQVSSIAEQCQYDLRACLNAIQFSPEGKTSGSIESVESSDWSALAKRQFLSSQKPTLVDLESCSDPDKLILACFTAYPDCSYIDDILRKPAAIGDYLALSDNRGANSELKAFTAYAFGSLFRSPRLAAQDTSLPLHSRKLFWRPPSYHETIQRTRGILSTVTKSCNAHLKPSIPRHVILLEILPFLVDISNPVTPHILGQTERTRLDYIAEILRSMGIGFRTERLENGTILHRIDPPIELTCLFDEIAQSNASAGSYLVRNYLKETMHQKGSTGYPRAPLVAVPVNNVAPPKEIEKKPRVAVDLTNFLGLNSSLSQTRVVGDLETKSQKVWVQYSEGFSNAVRKSINWQELFLI